MFACESSILNAVIMYGNLKPILNWMNGMWKYGMKEDKKKGEKQIWGNEL